MSDEIILEVKDLEVQFEGDASPIIKHINFSVKKGDVLAVLGPNGAGKSVLFRALLGLVPHKGEIIWKENVRIGYVPQKLAVEKDFPITVKEFLTLKKDGKKHDITHALTAVGLSDHKIQHQRLGDLSGGQFQRVLIAWSLVGNPDVLLFDEPTAGVDLTGEETIYNLLHHLQDIQGLTIILISHDLMVVSKYANSVVCINKQQICFGEPESILNTENLTKLYGGETKLYHHIHEK